MNILTAIENKKINEQLKNNKNINILNSDIQYKEGILEYLEKNKKVEIIILKENLPGQIQIKELIKEIQKINHKIKIIIIINEKNKETKENTKNINYIYLEKITEATILKVLKINKEKNKKSIVKGNNAIIKITGNSGSGKTTFTIICAKILSEIKNKKILLIEEDERKILTKIYLKNKYKNNQLIINKKLKEEEQIKIENKLYLLNNEYLINKKINIINYLNKIKKEFNYIIIDSDNKNKIDNKIINQFIFLLEANIMEIEKAKKQIINNKIKIIFNKANINNIAPEIFGNIIHKKILGKINNSQNINLFINNNFNLDYLNKKEKNNFLNLIEKILRKDL